MPISVSCPACGKRLKVPDELVGRRAKCVCGTVLSIPAAEPVPLPLTVQPMKVPPVVVEGPEEESEPGLLSRFIPEDLRVTAPKAVLWMLVSLAVGGPLLVGALYLMRATLFAAEEFSPGTTAVPHFLVAPLLLAAFFGLGFGFASGKLITGKGGLVGWPACVIGLVGVAGLYVIGQVTVGVLFGGGIHAVVSLSLGAVCLMSAVGIFFCSLWLD